MTENYRELADYYYFDKEYEMAALFYQKAIDSNPSDQEKADIYNGQSYTCIILKDYQKALDAAKKGLEIAPNHWILHGNKGIALYKMGLYEDAIVSLTKSLDLDDNNALCYCYKGQALVNLGRENEAVFDFERAKDIMDHDRQSTSISDEDSKFIRDSLASMINLLHQTVKLDEVSKTFTYNTETMGILDKFFKFKVNQRETSEQVLAKMENPKDSTEYKKLQDQYNNLQNQLNEFKEGFLLMQQQMKKVDMISGSTLMYEEAKKKAEEIISFNSRLGLFYRAFLSEFSIAFISAQSILSEKVKTSSENSVVNIISQGLSYLPLVGEPLKSGIDYVSDKFLEQNSRNISNFGVNTDTLAKKSAHIASIILQNESAQGIIINYSEKESQAWIERIQKLVEKRKAKLEQILFKKTSEVSPQENYAREIVSEALSNFIANGKIFEIHDEKDQNEKIAAVLIENINTPKEEKEEAKRIGGATNQQWSFTKCCNIF